jgi:hypothetical protein
MAEPTQAQVDQKKAEYDHAAADRSAKREVLRERIQLFKSAEGELNTALADYKIAIEVEAGLEDEVEALQIAHEPDPAEPELVGGELPPQAK